MGPNSNFTLWKFVLLGRLPNANVTPGSFAHFGGPLWHFEDQRLKIKFYSGDIFSFGESPKPKFYCGVIDHFWAKARSKILVRAQRWEKPQGQIRVRVPNDGKKPRNKIWFWAPEPQKVPVGPQNGLKPRSKVWVWETHQKDKCPQSKVWFWSPETQNAPVGPQNGQKPPA
jgi:hypothetical protein